MSERCVLRVHQGDQVATLRVEGRATMNESPTLRRFAEVHLGHDIEAVRMDLCRCTYMDSTFLGTLLFLHRAAGQRGPGHFCLVSPSPECCRQLQQMGLLEVFPIADAEPFPDSSWQTLTEPPADRDVFKWNVVQAHQELANVGGAVADSFRSLANVLASEIDARR